jgi:hypothetical protein
MARFVVLCFALGFVLPFLTAGRVAWDNGVHWVPAIAFGTAASLGLTGAIEDTDERAARLVGGILGLVGFMLYPVYWIFFVYYASY